MQVTRTEEERGHKDGCAPRVSSTTTTLGWHSENPLRCALGAPLSTGHHELVDPPAPVLGNVDVAARIHRDAVRLVELTGKVS
jgi:hypothetical protein